MKNSKIALLIAAAIPTVLAYKKYESNKEHYDKILKEKFDDMKHCLKDTVKCAETETNKVIDIITKHEEKAKADIKEFFENEKKKFEESKKKQ